MNLSILKNILEGGTSSPAKKLLLNTAFEQWRLIIGGLFTSILAALSEGLTLFVVFLIVDVLTASGPSFSLALPFFGDLSYNGPVNILAVVLLVAAVFLQGFQSVMRYWNKVFIGYFSARCRARITSLVNNQILSLSYACSSSFKVGELNNFIGVAPAAVQIEIETLSNLALNLLMVSIYVIALIRISPWLLLAAVAMALVITSLQKFLEPRIRDGSRRQACIDELISSRAIEDYQALRLLHSSGQLELAAAHLDGLMIEMEDAFRAQSKRLSLLEPVASFLPIVAVSIIVTLSLFLLRSASEAVIPGLVTFVLALQRLNVRVGGISNDLNGLAANLGRLEIANKILRCSDKVFRRTSGDTLKSELNSIEFLNISLSYDNGSSFSVDDVSFSMAHGKTYALVGPSGAGKSSIADMIVGLYEPTAGQIFINNSPMLGISLSSWQQRLGVVSQDTFLFNASIAENLIFGLQNVSQQQLERAATQAQAAGFIEALPDGYDTLVGERGYRLSGGQRQRLSLARALLRQPELLILDEATSALDSASERLVQEAIQQVEGQCTVLVIAHRLSTIVNADQILVLDRGRIIQRGSHHQLLEAAGMYQKLWKQQSHAAAL